MSENPIQLLNALGKMISMLWKKIETIAHYEEFTVFGVKVKQGLKFKNKQTGLWTEWHDNPLGPWSNGNKWKEGHYCEGKETGFWTYWYSNGQINALGYYEKGKEKGYWLQY